MRKTTKLVICMLAVTAAVGAAGINAAAYHGTGTYCSWDWGYNFAKTTSKCQTDRLASAAVAVYSDNTGDYVTGSYAQYVIPYYDYVQASKSVLTYPSSAYNFICSGGIYNTEYYNSGVAESWRRDLE